MEEIETNPPSSPNTDKNGTPDAISSPGTNNINVEATTVTGEPAEKTIIDIDDSSGDDQSSISKYILNEDNISPDKKITDFFAKKKRQETQIQTKEKTKES